MKKLFNRLRPIERRLVIGGVGVLFILFNIISVWPHFRDWERAKTRLEDAHATLDRYSAEIRQASDYQKKVRALEQEGGSVSTDDQANEFLRAVQSQAMQSGVDIVGTSKQTTKTNEFFLEQLQTFAVQSGEPQLVGFLFNLGSAESMIRVRDLALRPDSLRQKLGGSIKLVASYQKKTAPKTKPAASAPKTATANKPVTTTAKNP